MDNSEKCVVEGLDVASAACSLALLGLREEEMMIDARFYLFLYLHNNILSFLRMQLGFNV